MGKSSIKNEVERCYAAYSCGAQNRLLLLFVANDFDRGAISHSLHPPPAAVVLNATKLSHASIVFNDELLNAFY